MLDDPVNFVRQGVLVASALILLQHSEASHSKVPSSICIIDACMCIYH